MYFEATANLTGDILTKVDRSSMAASLEVRSPMLDHLFAELAVQIPPAWKWRDGKGKRILLDALGDRLPPELLTRSKMGFGVPIGQWFRGPLRELVYDSLPGGSFWIGESRRRNSCGICWRNTAADAAAINIKFMGSSCWSSGSAIWQNRFLRADWSIPCEVRGN